MKSFACIVVLCLGTLAVAQGAKPVEALSRIYNHKDGTRTETRKDGDKNEIHEKTFRNNILICKRIFFCDGKGRTRQGVIYDGRMHPMGSIFYGYDKTTDQLVEEQQYNRDGKLVRRLFYPGALKDARYANRFVAFTFDPNDPKANPVQDTTTPAVPTRPVQSDQDEFEPGVPLGTGAPSTLGTAPSTPARPATPAPAPATAQPRKRFLKAKS
jgi:hypothetical protein